MGVRELGNGLGNPLGLQRTPIAADVSAAVGDVIFMSRDPGQGWMPADGRVVAAGEYPALFSAFGNALSSYTDASSVSVAGTAPTSGCSTGRGGFAFDSTGTYLAAMFYSPPYLYLYKRSGDTFTRLPDPASSTENVGYYLNVAFDPTGTYLACGSTSVAMILYKRSGDTFTKLPNPTTMPGASTSGQPVFSFDPTGTYLATTSISAPYIIIYKRSGDAFTKLPDPATLPATGGSFPTRGISFDPTGSYLAVSSTNAPYLYVYKRSGDVFTLLTNTPVLPASSVGAILFDPTGNYLAVAVSNGFNLYRRSEDTFSLIANATGFIVNTLSFDRDGTYLAVAGNNASKVYQISNDTITDMGSMPAISGASQLGFDPATSRYLVAGYSYSPYINVALNIHGAPLMFYIPDLNQTVSFMQNQYSPVQSRTAYIRAKP